MDVDDTISDNCALALLVRYHVRMLFIVGGLGFIGTHAAREFADHGEQVAVSTHRTIRDTKVSEELFQGRVTVVSLDMTDGAAVAATFDRLGVDSVCNLLAPPPGAWEVGEEYRANMIGLLNILEAAQKRGVRRLTQASSAAVYAQLPPGAHDEDAPLPMNGRNSTEAFKKAEEVLAGHFADRTGLDMAIVRFSGIYGPLYHSLVNFPSRVAHAAVKGRPLPLERDGQPLVYAGDGGDMCCVKDAVLGLRLIHNAPKLQHRVYNVASGVPTTNADVAAAAHAAQPSFSLQLPSGSRGGSGGVGYSSIARIQSDLGYAPHHTIGSGMAEYMSWLASHEE